MPIGSMYGIYANIGGILMVNVTIYDIHGSYGMGIGLFLCKPSVLQQRKFLQKFLHIWSLLNLQISI